MLTPCLSAAPFRPPVDSNDESGAGVPRDAGVFATTHWSMVRLAGGGATVESKAALDQLCRQYWKPLYYFVRRKGYSEADAQDLVQGFFARLLEKGLFEAADRERGRFRTFLLSALDNYVANQWARAHRQKRGGDREIFSLEGSSETEAAYQLLPPDLRTPVHIYERRWAQAILQTVLDKLRAEFEERHGPGRYDLLKEFLFTDRGEISYAEVATRAGLSESAVKSAIYRLRQRYAQLFEEVIAQTVSNPDEVDDEIEYILRALESA